MRERKKERMSIFAMIGSVMIIVVVIMKKNSERDDLLFIMYV